MKKNLKNFVLLLSLGFTIYLCFRNYKLNSYIRQLPDSSILGTPDTVWLTEKFQFTPEFSQLIEPSRILLYDLNRNNSNRMTTKSLSDSTAVDSDINPHLVKISKKDSLVQFILDNHQLNISLFNQETNSYSTRLFNLDLKNYNYNWYEGQLTRKRIRRLSLNQYVYGKYRPFNQLFDIGTGLTIKTTNFNYKLGVNAFCYPKYFSGIKADFEFSIQYNF